MDFDKICMMFSMQEPFYGTVLSSMDKEAVKVLPTLGVRRSGEVFTLGYNPDYMKDVKTDLTTTLFKHEVLHVAFGHLTMWGDTSSDTPKRHKLRNIAEDLEVNCYLDKDAVRELNGVLPSDFGFQERLGAVEYFRLLTEYEEKKQKEAAKNPQKPCNGGQGGDKSDDEDKQGNNQKGEQKNKENGNPNQQNGDGNQDGGTQSQQQQKSDWNVEKKTNDLAGGNPNDPLNRKQEFGDHSNWPSIRETGEKEELQSAIDSMINLAEEACTRAGTHVPDMIKEKLDSMIKKPKAVTDWKKYLRRNLGNDFSDLLKKSRKRESKRFPDAAGNRHQRKSHILIGVDTSGSLDMKDFMEFIGQIKTLSDKATFRILECDTAIRKEYEYKKNMRFDELHGRGGTSYVPVIEYFKNNRKKYDALVYFTDGYCEIPSDTPKETLWVISSRGDHNANRYKVNGASVVMIKNEK